MEGATLRTAPAAASTEVVESKGEEGRDSDIDSIDIGAEILGFLPRLTSIAGSMLAMLCFGSFASRAGID